MINGIESVTFIVCFKTWAEAETYLKRMIEPKPELLGILEMRYDENLSLYAVTTKQALEEIQK